MQKTFYHCCRMGLSNQCQYKTEVVTMCITEYNEVETMETFKEEGHDGK